MNFPFRPLQLIQEDDFGTNFGCPTGTQKRCKTRQTNVMKWETIMDTILGFDLDRFGDPKRTKIRLSKAANEQDPIQNM